MKRPVVLVVDDQLGIRLLLEELFRDTEIQVRLAANGRQALDVLEAEAVGLVLLDMKMPVMDGIATLREIRKRYANLPVVMMTAVGEVSSVNQALELGALRFITKPFDAYAVRTIVEALLRGEEPPIAAELPPTYDPDHGMGVM